MVAAISGASDKIQGAATATLTVADTLGRMTKEDILRMTRSVANAADRVTDTVEAMNQVQGSLSQSNTRFQGTLSYIDIQLQGTTRALKDAAEQLEKAAESLKKAPWWVRIIPRRRPQGTGTP